MEVIWTSSASEDYLRAETSRSIVFSAAVDGALCLLQAFPKMGTRVRHSKTLRRILVGKMRRYGLYYGLTPKRITVVALVDLRQDPDSIDTTIRNRQP
jgi:hypothetical protein